MFVISRCFFLIFFGLNLNTKTLAAFVSTQIKPLHLHLSPYHLFHAVGHAYYKTRPKATVLNGEHTHKKYQIEYAEAKPP